jgi:GAF domain-containing protein
MDTMSVDLTSGVTEHRLLQSIVEVARHVYGAAASSVFMVSPDTGELIFAAVSGAGEQSLVGVRFPAGTGIAGWVVASGQPIIADEVADTDYFARDAATSTGYLPSSIMAAPLISDGECIGVLEVLDRHTSEAGEPSRELGDMELLGLLATQAALGLTLLRQRSGADPSGADVSGLLSRLSEHAVHERFDPPATKLLAALVDVLDHRPR